MAIRNHVTPFLAGMLAANSLPHLATAVTGRRHLTPLAGRSSSWAVNLAWGAANLAGGLALVRSSTRSAGGSWDRRLVAFEAGAAAFSLWMAGSEAAWPMNTTRQTG